MKGRKRLTKRNKEDRLTWEDIRAFLKVKLKREPVADEILALLINRQHLKLK